MNLTYVILGFGLGFGLGCWLTIRDFRKMSELLERLIVLQEKETP